MNNDKFHCPKCKLLFDSVNHLPRILKSCSHSLCSYCINEQLQKSESTVICPLDNTPSEGISSITVLKENQNLLEEIQESLNIPSNHNYEISNEEIIFDKSAIMNSDKFNDTMNSLNLNSSINSNSHCYYKKSKEIRNLLSEKNNINKKICNIHSLPLNVICIDEKKKICSQCALSNEHTNHQIITEIEFMNNIDNLIDIFQEVDNKQIKYLNFSNINTISILDKINNNINDLITMINKTKENIIQKIKNQCNNIENYLNQRKNEIFDKYQSTNFDITTLRESTLNWMQIVTKKLDQLNEIKDPSNECINLLDDQMNKNIFNLIRNGKQLNGRYNFIQETLKIIDKLQNFEKNGILIKPNNFIIDKIFLQDDNNNNKKEKYDEDIDINLNIEEEGKKINNSNNDIKDEKNNINNNNNIKSSLFDIEENKELINSLHLTQYNFEIFQLNDYNLIKIEKEKFIENKINNNKIQEKNVNNNKINLKDEVDNNSNKKKDSNSNNSNIKEDDDNDIILNLNIEEIKKENNNINDNNKKNENNEKESNINKTKKEPPNDKNNISKIIEDLSFNDDTLLINSLMMNNQNDTIYHKKIKNDYPLDLKNSRKKDRENYLIQKNDLIEEKEKEKPKTITTKRIDLSEINKNNKTNDENKNKKNLNNNKNNKNNSIFNINKNINTNLERSLDNNNDIDIKNINNKNEIAINFTKKISGIKKNKPICSNYMKSEKKNIFGKMKTNANGEAFPLMVSRSPGRLGCQSKLEGFYSFVPLEKINQKHLELNQYKNTHKTLMSSKDFGDNKNNKIFSDKNLYKNSRIFDEDTDVNTEYSSHINIRKNNNIKNKVNKKTKQKSDISSKIIKKMNSSKLSPKETAITSIINNKEKEKYTNFNINSQYIEHYNKLISVNSNPNIISHNNTTTSLNNNFNTQNNNPINISNNNNNINPSFETKSKKDLQEFIINQLKNQNQNPNFSRINMSGYGIQYLCSFLHKNPNINFKEIKLLGCNINDDDLFMLTRTLLDHDIEVLVLNLSSNKITDDSASNILDILKDCKRLKGLSLYNNMISTLLKDKLKEYVKLGRENYDMVQLYI